MPELVLPAGASLRLTATARADRDLHRWTLHERPGADGAGLLAFGSWIGGADVLQRIDIPAQDVERRLEVRSRHRSAQGWADDSASYEEDAPDRLAIGFCDPSFPGARRDDVLLSFVFRLRGGSSKEEVHGPGTEEIQPRSAQAQAGEGQAGPARPHAPGAGLAGGRQAGR